jgi:hypothetical protein
VGSLLSLVRASISSVLPSGCCQPELPPSLPAGSACSSLSAPFLGSLVSQVRPECLPRQHHGWFSGLPLNLNRLFEVDFI